MLRTRIIFAVTLPLLLGGAAAPLADAPVRWEIVGSALSAYGPAFVETMVFACRTLAGTMSVIAVMLWLRIRKSDEQPVYNRKLNDMAWNWFHAGCIVGSISFIALDFEYRRVTGELVGDIAVLGAWWCWGNAATLRVASRVWFPRYIYGAATVLIFVLPLYLLVVGG